MNHPQGHLPLGKWKLAGAELEPPSRCQYYHSWDVTTWYLPPSKLLLYPAFTGKSSVFCLFSLVRQRFPFMSKILSVRKGDIGDKVKRPHCTGSCVFCLSCFPGFDIAGLRYASSLGLHLQEESCSSLSLPYSFLPSGRADALDFVTYFQDLL